MKTIIMLMAIMATIFAGTITLKTGANVRANPSVDAVVVDTQLKGEVLEYTDSVASYYKVIIKSGSIHKGKTGYMWAIRVDAKAGVVTGKGVVLRSSPEYDDNGTPMNPRDDDNFIECVRAGAVVEILSTEISWYMVFKGWISAYCIKGNEP